MTAAEVEKRVRELVSEAYRTGRAVRCVVEMVDGPAFEAKFKGTSGSGAIVKLGSVERGGQRFSRLDVGTELIVSIRRGGLRTRPSDT